MVNSPMTIASVRKHRDQYVGQDDAGHDRDPAGAEALRRLCQRAHVDGAQARVDRAVHIGQRQRRVAEHQQDVRTESRAGQRQDGGGVVEADVSEHHDDRGNNQRQQGYELDDRPPGRQLQPHPVGSRDDEHHPHHDGGQRHRHRIGERLLEPRVTEYDPVGIEAVHAAPHLQRELDRADQREREVGNAQNQEQPGPEAIGLHFSHRSLRVRNQM
jgi:hypothetical protein